MHIVTFEEKPTFCLCGGTPVFRRAQKTGGKRIRLATFLRCVKCGVRSLYAYSKPGAIRKWNALQAE